MVASLYLPLGWVCSDLHQVVLSTDVYAAQCRVSQTVSSCLPSLEGSESRGRLVDVEIPIPRLYVKLGVSSFDNGGNAGLEQSQVSYKTRLGVAWSL